MLFEMDNDGYDIDFLLNGVTNPSPNMSSTESPKIFPVNEGFIRGNMYINEYKPYKNYTPMRLKGRNEREMLLLRIYELDFAINDFNLYLDLHPNDSRIYEEFKKCVKESKKLKSEYEEMYGPLCLTEDDYKNYKWDENPWPWDKMGGSMYV